MPSPVASRALRRARVSLAVVIATTGAAIVFAGPSMGGVRSFLQASPSPTETSSSPSPSQSPSPSPTPTAAPRGIALTASDRLTTAGRFVTLAGQVVSSEPACESQQAVQIRRRIVGAPEFKLLMTVHTDSGGNFDTSLQVRTSAEYRATMFRTPGCETTASENVAVFVRVRVTISTSDNPIGQGNFFTISGRVVPSHRGDRVVLERKRGRGWRNVDATQLNNESRYQFTLAAGWSGERTFRVRWPAQDSDHEPNKSRSLIVRSV